MSLVHIWFHLAAVVIPYVCNYKKSAYLCPQNSSSKYGMWLTFQPHNKSFLNLPCLKKMLIEDQLENYIYIYIILNRTPDTDLVYKYI